jgi:maltose alpha-D-glucosyltransferase/alpha-amylase
VSARPEPEHWFETAIFYELDVPSFFDANDDGVGDFRGLARRLDYLVGLGVDCICLLPVYESPDRQGGYDVSDFEAVRRDYGTIGDLRHAVDAAHESGLRVLLDLALGCTSTEHQWFQESRNEPDGPRGGWYVWSDTDGSEAGPVHWTFDPVRGQYYRHGFTPDQPDLELAHPDVQEAMLAVCRFWLDLDVDGFRLGAMPPDPHAFLKRLRAELAESHPGCLLLGRPSGWLPRAAEYFGEGDECQVTTHFPLMRRLFAALRREDARPLYDLLAQTPLSSSDGTAWSFILRMYDELAPEPPGDEEREGYAEEYEKDPMMRRNLDRPRRLAPLLGNDRQDIELTYAVLFSLPGSPTLYYGDEIGMGDNPAAGAGVSVRTPMQWSADRNGGFSRADVAQLHRQPLIDPVYGYPAVNVEAQLRTPTSLLSWLRRFIALRKEHPLLALGSYEPLGSDNLRVFAHMRRLEDEAAVCVHNLATSAQPVQLDLRAFRGHVPEEMVGRTAFPPIGDLPYLLTLKPRGFLWLRIGPG